MYTLIMIGNRILNDLLDREAQKDCTTTLSMNQLKDFYVYLAQDRFLPQPRRYDLEREVESLAWNQHSEIFGSDIPWSERPPVSDASMTDVVTDADAMLDDAEEDSVPHEGDLT